MLWQSFISKFKYRSTDKTTHLLYNQYKLRNSLQAVFCCAKPVWLCWNAQQGHPLDRATLTCSIASKVGLVNFERLSSRTRKKNLLSEAVQGQQCFDNVSTVCCAFYTFLLSGKNSKTQVSLLRFLELWLGWSSKLKFECCTILFNFLLQKNRGRTCTRLPVNIFAHFGENPSQSELNIRADILKELVNVEARSPVLLRGARQIVIARPVASKNV